MKRTRMSQVKDYHAIVDVYGINKAYKFTLGNGSMYDDPRVKGWVVYQHPKLGDEHDFAKWYPNKREAELELKARV